MKKILLILLAIAMVFSFVSCDNSTPEVEETVKNGESLKKMFTYQADEVSVTDDGRGIILGQIRTENSVSGATAYLGENKLYPLTAEESATVSFSLDLSSLEKDDYTFFSLGYANENGEYNGESYLAIMKGDGNKYILATTPDIAHEYINYIQSMEQIEEYNVSAINSNEGKVEVESADGLLDVVITTGTDANAMASANGSKTVSLTYNLASTEHAEIKGLRYFWNVTSNVDTVVLTSLEISK